LLRYAERVKGDKAERKSSLHNTRERVKSEFTERY
jgi:hypothetical protein